jgi:hypothetical protein
MTIELFVRRLAGSLGFSGVGLLIAATVFWSTVHEGDVSAVHSVHTVAGSVLAVFGVVMIVVSLALTAGVPVARPNPQTGRPDLRDSVRDTD